MPNKFNTDLAAELERVIIANGDYKKAVAAEFGIPYTTFNSYVTGKQNVPCYVVDLIANKYDMTVEELFYPDGANSTKEQKLNNCDTRLMLESLATFMVISRFYHLSFSPGTKESPEQIGNTTGLYAYFDQADNPLLKQPPNFINITCPIHSPRSGDYDEWEMIINTLSQIVTTLGVDNVEKYKFMSKAISGLINDLALSDRYEDEHF